MMKKNMTRRTFLHGAGKVAIALPWLEYFASSSRAIAQSAGDQNLIVVFTPIASMYDKWVPTVNGTSFDIPTGVNHILEPLKAYQNQMLLVDGCGWPSMKNHLCIPAMYAGDEPIDLYNNFSHESNDSPKSPTFYRVIANSISGTAPYTSYEFGYENEGDSLFYAGPNQNLPTQTNPAAIWDKLFKGLSVTNDPKKQLEADRRKSVIDSILESYKDLRKKLGSEDQKRIDFHVDSLREVEKRVGVVRSCQKPTLSQPMTTPDVYKLQIELMAAAIACGLTHVASLQIHCRASNKIHDYLKGKTKFGNAQTDAAVDAYLGKTMHNETSHDTVYYNGKNRQGQYDQDREYRAKALTAIHIEYSRWIAYLVERLKMYAYNGATLFDNSVIMVNSELGEGGHGYGDMNNLPTILLHGQNGAKKIIRTGRYLNIAPITRNGSCKAGVDPFCPQPCQYRNDLYVGLANEFGLPIQAIGKAEFNYKPISLI